jgi:hypothetical protein
MTVTRTKKLSNPRRVVVRKKSNAKRTRRNLSPKQIKFFGTKRQRAALKARRSTHRPRTVPNKGRKRSPNPALVLTLGPVLNPNRRKRTMPATKTRRTAANKGTYKRRRKTVSANRRRVAKNQHRPRTKYRTKTVVKYRYRAKAKNRRRNPRRRVVVVKRKNYRRRTRRNPLFGASLGSKQSLMILGGGFTGLIAAKFIPTLLPASLTGSIGSSTGGRFILTLAAALASGWAATKFVNPQFGDGVLFGGLIQAGSVALNTFLPSIYTSLGVGLGDLMPGRFPVPQNPIRAAMAARQIAAPVGAQARVTMSGLTRAYGTAF